MKSLQAFFTTIVLTVLTVISVVGPLAGFIEVRSIIEGFLAGLILGAVLSVSWISFYVR